MDWFKMESPSTSNWAKWIWPFKHKILIIKILGTVSLWTIVILIIRIVCCNHIMNRTRKVAIKTKTILNLSSFLTSLTTMVWQRWRGHLLLVLWKLKLWILNTPKGAWRHRLRESFRILSLVSVALMRVPLSKEDHQ